MPSFRPDDVPDLTGKVAIVTGGNRSLGLETVYMLLRKNCTVYIAGRSETGYEEAQKNLSARQDITPAMTKNLHFHKLDLDAMKPAYETGQDFANKHDRLDILIANAGVSLQRADELSSDGYEKTFATNQLGHFAFIKPLLPLVERTAKEHGEARVVITTSDAHAFAKNGIDFESLSTSKPHTGMSSIGDAFQRYGVSKLANMLYARELDKRWAAPLRKQGVHIYVDSAHPGTITNTGLGGSGSDWGIPAFAVPIIRNVGRVFGFTHLEGAMTQTYVATSPEIPNKERHGLYYVPQSNWLGRYVGSQDQKPAVKEGEDDELATQLWSYCDNALNKALSV